MIKIKFLGIITIALIFMISGCSEDNSSDPDPKKPSAKIFVFSDPHILAPSLMTNGNPDDDYYEQGRKLLQESDAIMQKTIDLITNSGVDIVIVPGDLTKDGEKASMEKFANYMMQIHNAGIDVFVVPGNHDIDNPLSMDYSSGTALNCPTVSTTEFKQIFNDMTYSKAIATDPNSLSYVVEPVDGLWIIGMDACLYENNAGQPHSETGGKFKAETQQWIENQIQQGASKDKIIFGIMHHGLVEHFAGQKLNPISAEYVIENWQSLSDKFADLGMKVVFTGHFHANDIVKRTSAEGFIFEVETGSTVSYPCPYRILTLTEDRKLNINTSLIESVNYDTGQMTFQQYAQNYLYNGIIELAVYTLMQEEYGLSQPEAEALAPLIASAYVTHYAGDEVMPADAQAAISMMKQSGDQLQIMFATILESMFTDLPPADNNITIDLQTGNVTQ